MMSEAYVIMSHKRFLEIMNDPAILAGMAGMYTDFSDGEIVGDLAKIIYEGGTQDRRELLAAILRGVHDLRGLTTVDLTEDDLKKFVESCIVNSCTTPDLIERHVVFTLDNYADYICPGEFKTLRHFVDRVIQEVTKNHGKCH